MTESQGWRGVDVGPQVCGAALVVGAGIGVAAARLLHVAGSALGVLAQRKCRRPACMVATAAAVGGAAGAVAGAGILWLGTWPVTTPLQLLVLAAASYPVLHLLGCCGIGGAVLVFLAGHG